LKTNHWIPLGSPMYVYSRGGPPTAPAPRPSLIYCAYWVTHAFSPDCQVIGSDLWL
jgi:hypothetical protein